MGLIITNIITLDSGLQVTNAYANIGTNMITITKFNGPTTANNSSVSRQYRAETTMNIWLNKEKAIEGGHNQILKTYPLSIGKEEDEPFDENVYPLLYTRFKTNYGLTCQDAI